MLFRITPDSAVGTLKVSKAWADDPQCQGADGCQPRLPYPVKLSVTTNEERATFHNKKFK